MWYILNVLIALDQLINTLIGGSPDETLSARAYRNEQQGKVLGKVFRPVIDFIFWFDKEHCKTSYFAEQYQRQFPPYYRKG